MANEGTWFWCQIGQSMKCFISYSTIDKSVACILKNELERIGLTGFLAHEDISVSFEWQEKILKELRECDIFVALLSKNYYQSVFCIQESGISLYRKNCLIIPLSLDGTLPTGFTGKYQAKLINLRPGISDFLPALITKHKALAMPYLIKSINIAPNYREAEERFELVNLIEWQLTEQHANEILIETFNNKQVFHATENYTKNIPRFISKYKSIINPELFNNIDIALKKIDSNYRAT